MTSVLDTVTGPEAPKLWKAAVDPARPRRTSWLLTVVMLLIVAYFLFPLYWLVVASTKSNADLFSSFGLWFADFNFIENVRTVLTFQDSVFIRWFFNSILYAVVSGVGAAFLATAAGYAFAKYDFPGGKALFSIVLGAIMVPTTALAIPTYLLFARAELTDTYWAIILPSLVSPFGVFLMRVYAADAVDTSLMEAARVDGVGELRIFFTVALRLLMPGTVTGAAVRPGLDLEQLLPAAADAQLRRALPAPGGTGPVAGHCGRRVRSPGSVLHGDHRIAAVDHPAGHRLPVPAAVLAVGPVRRRRQGLILLLERTLMDTPRQQVLFGAAYYHEYQPSPRLDTDLDLMAEAGFSVIRVGESVWTTWEPEDGRFDLDWLAPVLDGAHRRGIGVILGTPTYAAPPWLARRYPEIAGETATGQPMPWGGRQEIDYTHPAFRFYAERVIRKISARYADHPAVIGFQVDNEPGLHLFHNRGVFQRFVDQLRHTYGDVDRLNEAWGLTYWSHRLSTWADLWLPDGNWQPQYDLAWRTFQAQLTTEFIAWQAEIVREYARDDQFVTTCISYERPTVDDVGLTRALDVTAGNPYYAMQDALAVPSTDVLPQAWATSGTWTLFLSADRMYASKQAPFLITETNAGSIGGSATNFPAFDGQWRQAAWAFVARGAEMIEYWHWHTHPLRDRDLLGWRPPARPAARPGVRRAQSTGRGAPYCR